MPNQTIAYFLHTIGGSHKLNPKEEFILSGRLKRKKLRQLGKKLHLSDERIRQIEKQSLTKLQSKVFQEHLF